MSIFQKSADERSAAVAAIERATAVPLMLLSFAYIGILIAPFAIRLTAEQSAILRYVDWSIWGVFAAEFSIRLTVAPAKLAFLRKNLAELAIVALPFLRPFALFRLVLVGRAIAALVRGTHLMRDVATRYKLNYAFGAALIWLAASAILITIFERRAPGSNIHDIGDGIWWAFVTIFTVGYGDKYPVTPEGRGVAIALMAVGLGLTGFVAGSIASFFVAQETTRDSVTMRDLLARIDALEERLTTRAHMRFDDAPTEKR